MTLKELIKRRNLNGDFLKDYHVMRFFSSFVAVSEGKIVGMTDPSMEYCPLVSLLYEKSERLGEPDSKLVKSEISRMIEQKIKQFRLFSARRKLFDSDIAVPFGASEMLKYAMRKKIIDVSVIVCDGAGSVIIPVPEIVQGIGARMNGLFFTSPIPEIIENFKRANCHIVFPDASIDQIKAVEEACKIGYKNIAVTINGYMEEEYLSKIKDIEKQYNVSVTLLIVCTTGVTEQRIHEIGKYADVVWSCASEGVRETLGEKAILQISERIPVFVLTGKGLEFVTGYADNKQMINTIDLEKQYLLTRRSKSGKIKLGKYYMSLEEQTLPVRSKSEPRFKIEGKVD